MFYFHVLVTIFCKTLTFTFEYLHFKKILKYILKHVVLQYYPMKSKNIFMLIIALSNIHEFNMLKYIL
jgi:hypothetical protein